MASFKHGIMLAALVPVTLLFAAACDDGADSSSSASQSSIDEASARIQRNEQMAAVLEMDKLGFHDMEESLANGTVDASFVPNTRTAIRVLALTNWDSSLKADATELHMHATDLLKALETEFMADAARHSLELHELAHDFEDDVWRILAKDLPEDAGGVGEHEDAPETTPGANGDGHSDATPVAVATP